jgi:hypothetical protein
MSGKIDPDTLAALDFLHDCCREFTCGDCENANAGCSVSEKYDKVASELVRLNNLDRALGRFVSVDVTSFGEDAGHWFTMWQEYLRGRKFTKEG